MSGVYESDFGPVPLPPDAPDMTSTEGREYARFIEAETQRFYTTHRSGLPKCAPSFKKWQRFQAKSVRS